MAKKYLKMHGSRRTQIGLLRAGIIYLVDDTDLRVAKAIKALTKKPDDPLKKPAGEIISKSKAEKEKAAVESLISDEPPVPSIEELIETHAETNAALEQAQAEIARLTAENAALNGPDTSTQPPAGE